MSSNLVKPKVFLKQCISVVSKYVENHDPVQYERIDFTKGLFSLRNVGRAITMDGHPRFYLLRVRNSEGLYLHVSVTLRPYVIGSSLESVHEFEGISVQFLQGTGNLFCRAEWDVKKKNEKLEHPQPHWHWGYEKMDKEPQLFELDDAGVGQADSFIQDIVKVEPVLPSIDFEELHYAMASKWATQDAAVETFSVPRLQTWIKNCITNVVDQYNYQVNKHRFESSKGW